MQHIPLNTLMEIGVHHLEPNLKQKVEWERVNLKAETAIINWCDCKTEILHLL